MTNTPGAATLAGLLVICGCACATTNGRGPGRSSEATESAAATHHLDKPPVLIRQIRPRYPREAYNRRIEGTVELQILIDKTGRVVNTRILKSIPALDFAAIECVTQWLFRPAEVAGEPVMAVALAPVTFRIEENDK